MELRRKFLKGSGAAALLAPLIGSGLLIPGRVLAAEWKRSAFTAQNPAEVLGKLGLNTPLDSREIVFRAPEIAENGGKVDLEILCNLPDTRSLLVIAEKNPMPLCAELNFKGKAQAYAKLQVKLAETMRVRAIARTADGRSHVAFREIKVTLGGCGG